MDKLPQIIHNTFEDLNFEIEYYLKLFSLEL